MLHTSMQCTRKQAEVPTLSGVSSMHMASDWGMTQAQHLEVIQLCTLIGEREREITMLYAS